MNLASNIHKLKNQNLNQNNQERRQCRNPHQNQTLTNKKFASEWKKQTSMKKQEGRANLIAAAAAAATNGVQFNWNRPNIINVRFGSDQNAIYLRFFMDVIVFFIIKYWFFYYAVLHSRLNL